MSGADDHGFHEGELAVQRAAGVEAAAARLEGMLEGRDLGGGAAAFLAQQRVLALASTDADGVLWASVVISTPGFLQGSGTRLVVRARPVAGDPLADLVVGQALGAVVLDPERRRRLRVNGRVQSTTDGGFVVDVDQAYGNCPQHITVRRLTDDPGAPVPAGDGAPGPTAGLPSYVAERLRLADTFFLGTRHPVRGADASHRGGPPGFVRVEGDELWWPDLAGNNMFNSLGNLAVDPVAAVAVVDAETREVHHLTGTARLVAASGPDDAGTGRAVRLHVERSVTVAHPHLRAQVPQNVR